MRTLRAGALRPGGRRAQVPRPLGSCDSFLTVLFETQPPPAGSPAVSWVGGMKVGGGIAWIHHLR